MPYLLILRRDTQEDLPVAHDAMLERFQTWTRGLGEAGILLAVERLKSTDEGITLRHDDGQLVTESGRYAYPDVIGYYLLDVDDANAAQQLAAACPILAAGGTVEIRETDPFMPAASAS